jgi:hypothetical protein
MKNMQLGKKPTIGRTTTWANKVEPPKLLTRKEVAVLAKVCTHTVARDVRAGRLTEIRFNRRRMRYHPDAVAAYLSALYAS